MAWPTTSDPKTEFATLRMTPAEAADLDAFAGGNRSAFVRLAVAEKIEREQRKAAKRVRKANEGTRHAEGD